MTIVEFIVGPRRYYVPLSCIDKYPDSYFAAGLRPEWNKSTTSEHFKLEVNDRDPELFQFVSLYLQFGTLPRNKWGDTLIDRKLLPALRDEADYFCLNDMVTEIDELLSSDYPACNYARDIVASMSDKTVLGYHCCNTDNHGYRRDYDGRYTNNGMKFHLSSISIEKFNNFYLFNDYISALSINDNQINLTETIVTDIYGVTKKLINYDSEKVISDVKLSLSGDFESSIRSSIARHCTPSRLCLSKVLVTSPDVRNELYNAPTTERSIGLIAICLKSKFEGGDVLVTNTSTGVKFNWHTASKCAEGHVMMMFDRHSSFSISSVSEGVQVLLILEVFVAHPAPLSLVSPPAPLSLVSPPPPPAPHFYGPAVRFNVKRPRDDCFDCIPSVFRTIYDEVYKHNNVVGIFTDGDYLERGFSVHTLEQRDKLLYEFAITNNLSITLMYVTVEGSYDSRGPNSAGCVSALRRSDMPEYLKNVNSNNYSNNSRIVFNLFDHKKFHVLYEESHDEYGSCHVKYVATAFIISKLNN